MPQEKKACQSCKTEFILEPEDFEFYENMKVPAPTWCPECRFQRRLAWVNLRTLYSRKLKTGEAVISMYPQESQLNIMNDKEWWNEKTDLTDFGIEYDFNKPFFEQYAELLKTVPLPHLQRNVSTFENSDFVNAATHVKNCYLVAAADGCENVSYSYTVEETKDSQDLAFTNSSELCFECINVRKSYRCLYCKDVESSNELIMCEDCVGCNNCVGSFGLRNKSYCIFNKQYSKENYEAKLKELAIDSRSGINKLKVETEKFFLTLPHQFLHGRNNDKVTGDYIYQSKNVENGFFADRVEDSKNIAFLRYFNGGTAQCQDYSIFGCNAERVYESSWCGLGVSNVKFSVWNYGSFDLDYCYGCHSSSDLFGCIGLRKKKFCILNKQYTEEEYKALVPKIIEQMKTLPYKDKKGRSYTYGEFFPTEISPFNYNETIAQDFIPETKERINDLGFSWKESTVRSTKEEMTWDALPDKVSDTKESIVGKLILCKAFEQNESLALQHNCTKVFKIIPQDLAFYQKLNLPLPDMCPNSRHAARISTLSLKTYSATCQCEKTGHDHQGHCSRKFKTTFAPEAKEIVYCEQCYLACVA